MSRPRPHADAWEAAGELPRALHRKAGDVGFLGVRYAARWGGSDLDYLSTCVSCEELVKGDSVGTAVGLLARSDFAFFALADEANEALRQTGLVPAIRGERIGAIGVSEPGRARKSPQSRRAPGEMAINT